MATVSNTEPLRIAIIGAGIGGLTLAVALGRYLPADLPVRIDIYEAASIVPFIGAGIAVFPRTWEVLSLLGLEDELEKNAINMYDKRVGGMRMRRSDRLEGRDSFVLKYDCRLWRLASIIATSIVVACSSREIYASEASREMLGRWPS